MRARWMALGTLLALVALIAFPAMAEHEVETESADRVLLHAYDPAAMQLLWSEMAADAVCEVDPEAEYTYELDGDDVIIKDEAGTEVELTDCTLNATDVTGPQGQVNHGTIVSAFVKALKEQGITGAGCYVKIIAGTDYGKGDQQVKVSDLSTTTTTLVGEEVEEPTVQFTVSETTCGKPDHAGGPPEGKGKPEWAGQGKPDHAGPPEGKGKP